MRRLAALLPALLGAWGCQATGDLPASFIAGARVLAIKAEPPEVAPGASSTVTALIVGAQGETPAVSWSLCRRPPLPGQAINPDCLTDPTASYLEPVGQGLTITATMPADITPAMLGEPDASGGVYLPLVAHVTVGGQLLTAVYRLRLGDATTGNHNPTIASVYTVEASGPTLVEEGVPLVVHKGDQVTFGVTLGQGSAELYSSPVAGGASVTESATTSWFASGGALGASRTNDADPTIVLDLDQRLPAAGSLIDLYLVTHDERGGTDTAHRTLQFE